jgi:sodium transport system ATP-binding protein
MRFALSAGKNSQAMIHVKDLTKAFSDLRAAAWPLSITSVSMFSPGKFFGLLGPTGKTTCLRILSTVLKPTSGEAYVAGFNVHATDGSAARIGFMSSNTGIYDRMSAWEMVEYFGRLYGIEEERLRADSMKSSRCCRCTSSATCWGRRCRPE